MNVSCPPVLWFQAAGDTAGQAWSELFRDEDGNGIMEFAGADTMLRPDRWSRELNFLGWQPHDGSRASSLPENARVRITVQWREAHDPTLWRPGIEDLYREPLAPLELQVLNQLDPNGTKQPADELEPVVRSTELAQRIDNHPGWAVYEQQVEFRATPTAHYALRIVGRPVTITRPPSAPTLPGQERFWELRPRVFVEVLDTAARQVGRPVWLDYHTAEGEIGVPADAASVFTIGAADLNEHVRSYSAGGPPLALRLLTKPDLLSYDGLTPAGTKVVLAGTGAASTFAAGLAGAALSAPQSLLDLRRFLHDAHGQVFHLP
jgi:hypothetical protein